jgi:hypothetical protein
MWWRSHVVAQHLDEERFGQALHHRFESRRLGVVLGQHVARERDQLRRGVVLPAGHDAHLRQRAQHQVVRAGLELDHAADHGRDRLVGAPGLAPERRPLAALGGAAELVPLRAMEEQQVVLAQQQRLRARAAMQPQLTAAHQVEGRLLALARIEGPLPAVIAPRHQADPQPQGPQDAGQHVARESFRHDSRSPGCSRERLYNVP